MATTGYASPATSLDIPEFVLQLTLALTTTAAILLAYWYWTRRLTDLPPGPLGLPIIGSSRAFRRGKANRDVFQEWADEYGSIYSVNMGPSMGVTVMLNDLDLIKDTIVKRADIFSDRYVPPIVKYVFTLPGSFTFESGKVWQERRRFANSALRSFGMGKRSLEITINEEARNLIQAFDESGGSAFDPSHCVYNAAANVICTLSFGQRFDYTDPQFADLISKVKGLFGQSRNGTLMRLFPYLLLTPLYSAVRERLRDIEKFIRNIVKGHRDSFDSNDLRDIIDMYIAEIKKRELNGTGGPGTAFDDSNVWRGILDLFTAGTETTAGTVLWLIQFMAVYPDVQKRVQAEIQAVVGSDRQPTWEDSQAMSYTNAVIMEVRRVRPVATRSAPHRTSKRTKINGYNIPKGTTVLYNIWSLLHDPKEWKEPDKFNPSRFLSEDEKTLIVPEAYIPFGIGSRVCLGRIIANTELFLYFTNILQQFEISYPSNEPAPSLAGREGLTYNPSKYRVCARVR